MAGSSCSSEADLVISDTNTGSRRVQHDLQTGETTRVG
jgi:hypothetical protein